MEKKKKKRIKRWIIGSFSLVILIFIAYSVYGICWMYKLRVKQNEAGENLPDQFKITFPIQRDPNGYFCVQGKINGGTDESFILDTKASCLSRIENLNNLGAKRWGYYPRLVKNLYGQRERMGIYEIKSLTLHDQVLINPLFDGIKQTNAMYDLLYKNVMGSNALKQFSWKFSLDDGTITLFSNKDSVMLESESAGFIKIKNGIRDQVQLSSPDKELMGMFNFDLGYEGCISIDRKLFDKLKVKYPIDKYLNERVNGRIDTTYVFNNIDVNIADIPITNNTLCYYPSANQNVIGVKFIDKLNFILGYQKAGDSVYPKEDLFIQRRKNDDRPKDKVSFPNVGLDINNLNGEITLTLLKIGGKAEKAGLKIGDKILDIDSGAVTLNEYSVMSGIVESYLYDKQQLTLKIERVGQIMSYDIK